MLLRNLQGGHYYWDTVYINVSVFIMQCVHKQRLNHYITAASTYEHLSKSRLQYCQTY